MKKCLVIGLFLSMVAQASTYFMPGLYGNALSGYYNACFSGPGASIAPLYTQLLQPPAWSAGFANTTSNPISAYSLDPVFGPNSWINSGLTQFTPKTGGQPISDSAKGAFTNPALLGGNALWSINKANLSSYITNNSTTGDLAYYNAATIEYLAARLAMASAAFVFSPSGSTNQNSFLNVLYPASNTTALQERAIVSNFVTAAENLFSWSRYLRNITTPDSIGLTTTNGNSQITQASGFTLGALETFAGLIIINTSNTPSTSSNGVYGIQQVVIPSGQATPVQASTLPKSAMPTVSPTQKGLINPLLYPITVNAPVTSLTSRFTYPGLTSFMVNLPNQNSVSFLPVATQVYAITPNASSLYAVQEPADNWANAPVANPGSSFFRQVAFQTPNTANGQTSLPAWSYIVGVGVMGASSAATTTPIITFQPNVSASGYNQFLNSGTYTPVTVDASSSQVPINFPVNFFEDKQPWAVVVTMTANSQYNPSSTPQTQSPVVATVTGVVKLNSFDFPLMFAQDPLAQGYSAATSKPKNATGNMVAPANTTYGVKKERERWLAPSSLLPVPMKGSTVSLANSLGIAFSQRDVWMGISNLYALTLQANLERPEKDMGREYWSTNYSFAYMFLQALFNGHLYSTTANSLYSVMKKNNEIVGETQIVIPNKGIIGNLSYDYVTENNLPLYSLPTSASTSINITSTTPKAKGIWPINEARKEPQMSDWLQPGTPLDWMFLRAVMVGRALMENTGITAAAFSSLPTIMNSPTVAIPAPSANKMPLYIPQTNTIVSVSSVASGS
jgi:hypothetical protein